jgi:hypothetical protein
MKNNFSIEWWGIKVRLADGTFHYVSVIPSNVAKVVDNFLDDVRKTNLEKERN